MLVLLTLVAVHAAAAAASDTLVGTWEMEGQEQSRVTFAHKDGGLEATVFDSRRGDQTQIVPVDLTRYPPASLALKDGDRAFRADVYPEGADELRIEFVAEGAQLKTAHLFRISPGGTAAKAAAASARRLSEEVSHNLADLVGAERGYSMLFDEYEYVACGPFPRPVTELTPQAIPWPDDSAWACGSQSKIGWKPDGPTRGTYSVELSTDKQDFVANAWEDADGDGVPAHWIASSKKDVERVTPAEVK